MHSFDNTIGANIHIYERPNYEFFAVYQKSGGESYISESLSANKLVKYIPQQQQEIFKEEQRQELIPIENEAEQKKERIKKINLLNTSEDNKKFWENTINSKYYRNINDPYNRGNYSQELFKELASFLFRRLGMEESNFYQDNFTRYDNNNFTVFEGNPLVEYLMKESNYYSDYNCNNFWKPEFHSALKNKIAKISLQEFNEKINEVNKEVEEKIENYKQKELKNIVNGTRQLLAQNGYSINGIKMV